MELLKKGLFCLLVVLNLLLCSIPLSGQVSEVWVADNGDGTYSNPILHADYSDPDVVRVGNDFYMTASSFNCVPGLPILHSTDLVNWDLINYALPSLKYAEGFSVPQHGKGIWAPCLRHHQGEYYIYFPDPDFGIYVIKATDPKGPWSEPVLVKNGKGLIDPTPLWDDNGKTYLAHAFAGSRAGVKSVLVVCSMSADGTRAFNDEVIVLDGLKDQPTVEGPKFYKRNGYYYLFAPAGGVATGWQLVLRSRDVKGPYESKIVMDQGASSINGPHQGAWIDTPSGEDWFIHFQDKGPYGRVIHLQPMQWKDDWPVIGPDKDGDGKGEPVLTYKKPSAGKGSAVITPPESDEFNTTQLGLQWQWHANPEIYWGLPTSMGYLKLFCRPFPEGYKNLWDVSNLFLQKFPAPKFTATTKMALHLKHDGERVGLVVMGRDYAYISVKRADNKLYVSQGIAHQADKGSRETEHDVHSFNGDTAYFKVEVTPPGTCSFSISGDGRTYKKIGNTFQAREGGWIGAKVGLFALRDGFINDAGSANVDWFRVEKLKR